MKKIWPVFIVMMCLLTSCSLGGLHRGIFGEDNASIANNTFGQVVNAIENQDKTALKALFSETVHQEAINFDANADDLLNFIQGEIIPSHDTTNPGVGMEGKYEYGKKRKEIQSAFCIETSEQKYYIAINECSVDTFDKDNVGVKSIYIINAEDWKDECVYRGEGEWKLGINIVT